MGLVVKLRTAFLRQFFCLFLCLFFCLALNSGLAVANPAIAGDTVWSTNGYGVPAKTGFGAQCNACHNSSADGFTNPAAVANPPGDSGNLQGALGLDLYNTYYVPGTITPNNSDSAKIKALIDLTYAPKIIAPAAALVLDKKPGSTVSGGNYSAGTAAFRDIAFNSPALPYTVAFSPYTTAAATVSDGRFAISAAGAAVALTSVAPAPFKDVFGTVSVYVKAQNSEGLLNSSGPTKFTLNLHNNLPSALTTTNYAFAKAGTTGMFGLQGVDPDGDTLHYSNVQPVSGNGGSATVDDTGHVTFTPPATVGPLFSENFTIDVSNIDPVSHANQGTVTLPFAVTALAGANTPPTAVTNTFAVQKSASVSGTIATDPDAGTAFTFTSGGQPITLGVPFALPHGSITIAAPVADPVTQAVSSQFTFTDANNDLTQDVFSYTVTNGLSAPVAGTLIFNKTPFDYPPTAIFGPVVSLSVVTDQTIPRVIDLTKYIQDQDTPLNQDRFQILQYIDTNAGVTPPATYGTFTPLAVGEIAQGLLSFVNRPNVALDFNIQFRVGPSNAAPSTAPCTLASTDCGMVHVQVFLNGNAPHNGMDRATLAAALGSKYVTIPGDVPNFPIDEGQGACYNCHTKGVVTQAAPVCDSGFFNALGTRICKIRPFQQPFSSRINDAILGQLQGLPSFEPTVTQVQSVLNVDDNTPVGTIVGKPIQFTTGLDLDGNPSKILAAYLASPAGDYFDLVITNDGGGGGLASGSLKVKQSLTGLTTGNTFALTPLPVNAGGRRNNLGDAQANQQGFYPVFGAVNAMQVNVVRQLPKVVDDAYQTSLDPAPLGMNVTANDTTGGTIDSVYAVTNPGKGTITVNGKNFVYVSDGIHTGTDSFTYRARRDGVGDSLTAATVTIQIYPAGAAVAEPDGPYSVVIGEPANFPVQDNDRGIKPFTAFSIITPQPSQFGTAKIVGNQIAYTAAAAGTDVFQYQITGGGVTTSTTVTVNVGKVSGAILAAATSNPALKPVAAALGDTCKMMAASPSVKNADQVDLASICNQLADQAHTQGAIDTALSQIQNTQVLAAGDAVMEHERLADSDIFGRLDAIRGGKGRGLNFSQFSMQIDGTTLPGSLIDATIHKAGWDGAVDGKTYLPWGAFFAGSIAVVTQDSSASRAGFTLAGGTITTGIDYAISDKSLIGIALTSGQTMTSFGSNGNLTASSTQLAAYGSFQMTDQMFIDGYGGLAYNSFDLNRNILFSTLDSTINRTASGAFDGEAFTAAARLKYITTIGAANLETFGTFNYLGVRTHSFAETGAGGLGLSVGEQNFDTLTATAGFRLSQKFAEDFGTLTPHIGLSYARQLISDNRSVSSYFTAGGFGSPTFTVSTGDVGVNSGNVVIGLDAETFNHAILTSEISGTFSDSGLQGYAARISLNIPLGASASSGNFLSASNAPALAPPPAAPQTIVAPGPLKKRPLVHRKRHKKLALAPNQGAPPNSGGTPSSNNNGAGSAGGGGWGR